MLVEQHDPGDAQMSLDELEKSVDKCLEAMQDTKGNSKRLLTDKAPDVLKRVEDEFKEFIHVVQGYARSIGRHLLGFNDLFVMPLQETHLGNYS